jgi:hypothetical protein
VEVFHGGSLETSIHVPFTPLSLIYPYTIMKAQAVARVAGAGVLIAAGANAEVAFKVSPPVVILRRN